MVRIPHHLRLPRRPTKIVPPKLRTKFANLSVDNLTGMKNRITLVTKLPSTPEGLTATSALLEQLLFLVDTLTGRKFRPEVTKKLKSTRAEAITRFTKSLAVLEEKETQQEISQRKKVERERAEKERVSKLSAEEQRKYVERERKGNTKSYTLIFKLIVEGQKVARK